MEGEAANAFSKTNLIGPGLTPAETQNLTEHYSIEKHVGKTFPPTFLFHTKDDADVSVENAVRMDDALTAAGVRTIGEGGKAREFARCFVLTFLAF
jgi:acetyl esterase/lipase